MPRLRPDRMVLPGVLAPMVVAVVMLVALCIGGFNVLSAVRAYVGGESLWSKARAAAVAHLRAYAATGQSAEYRRYLESLAVPLGDRGARLELDTPRPNADVVRAGFLAGENSPDDVAGLARLYRWFRHVDFMEEAIATWAEGDRLIEQLQAIGGRIQVQVERGDPPAALAPRLAELDAVDERLVDLERYFSATLGRASRQTEQWLVVLTLGFAAVLLVGGALLVRSSIRRELAHRQRLVEANERWQLGADSAGIGLFEWNVVDDRFDLDPRAAALFGLGDAPVSLRRADLRARVHPDDQAFVRQAFERAVREGGLFKDRYRVALADGEWCHQEAIGRVRQAPGDDARMVGIVRDISAELTQAQLALEKEAAERAARLRADFLSRLSRDLRTPLNALLGAAQLLALDPAEPLTPGQDKRVRLLLRSGDELQRLIEDVLDITRIESGSLSVDLAAVDLLAAVRRGLDVVEPERAAFHIRIDDRMPHRAAMVKADAERLQQAFVNLLGSGCRFNTRGGLLALAFGEDEQHAWVTMAHEGPGLAAEDEALLRQPMRRLSVAPDVSGAGLSLVVAKLLIEQMDGAFSVDGRPGPGASFTVRLPRA